MSFYIDDPIDGPVGRDLWQRADRVLPGNEMYLSRSADIAGRGVIPGFIAQAKGCHVTDVDGRTYIDYLAANGPNLLGYQHPEVEDAVNAQAAVLTSASMFPPALVELAEKLLDRFDAMNFAVITKTGSDAVSLAERIAREHRQKIPLVVFHHSYHGCDPELNLVEEPGIQLDLTRQTTRLPWNDPQALADHVAAHGNDIAAIILSPMYQYPHEPVVFLGAEFLGVIEDARQRYGIQLVQDDIRWCFRLHPRSSYEFLGITPDLIAMGKALGNGHAVSAVLGANTDLKAAAGRIMYTSTYMFEAPPMHAAMATMKVYDRDNAFDQLTAMGTRLKDGFIKAAAQADVSLSYEGPVSMPSIIFDDDPVGDVARRFCREAAERGALLHPFLNWCLSSAHTESDIDETLEIVAASLAAIGEQ